MSNRVYVLLEVIEGKSAQIARAIKGKRGVVMAYIGRPGLNHDGSIIIHPILTEL